MVPFADWFDQSEVILVAIVEGPELQELLGTGDDRISRGSVVTIDCVTGTDTYTWYVDGELVADENDSVLRLDTTTMEVGNHHVTSLITAHGVVLSDTLSFIVTD